MSAPRRYRALPADPSQLFPLILSSLAVLVTGVVWVSVHVGCRLAGVHARLPGNPFALALGLVRHRTPWPVASTWVAGALVALLLGLLAVVVVAPWRGRRTRTDRAAGHMGRGRDLAGLSPRAARAAGKRLGGAEFGGLPLGVAVSGGRPLVSGPEDVTLDVWGPRQGKTSARVIPAALAAPGWLLVTSNKRDAVDALRDVRGGVWVWDPQALVGEEPSWFWNPLSYVTDDAHAAQLARLWTSAARPPGARPDAFFDPAGTELLGHLLHAAALAGAPVTEVYRWLTRPNDRTPAGILAGAGYGLAAASVLEVVDAPEKQRAGVFGSAKQTVSFLTNTAAARWVTPGPGRTRFDPAAFVRTADSLFALSREGVGDTGPLTTALTVAVCEAAEDLAKVSPGGRLTVPGVVLLDEAANVCRWNTLPDLYSHYGSRGVLLATFLQSWSQGEEVWGRAGMRKLWSAATVKVVGSGISEVDFLADVAQLVGNYRPADVSRSSGPGGSSSSSSLTSEHILDVADLAGLPRGRVVVLPAGAPAVLARPVPWWKTGQASAVRASVAAHDPAFVQNRTVEPDVPAAGAAWS